MVFIFALFLSDLESSSMTRQTILKLIQIFVINERR